MGGLLNLLRDEGFRTLLRSTAGVLVLRIATAVSGLLAGLLLANLLGPAELGTLAFAGACGGILGALATSGFNQLLVREIAVYHRNESWGRIKGILSFCIRGALGIAVVLSILAWLLAWLVGRHLDMPSFLPTFAIILLGVPIGALIQMRQAAMRGLNRTVLAVVPEEGILPVLSLLLLLAALVIFEGDLSAPMAAMIGLIGAVVAFIIGQTMFTSVLPDTVRNAGPEFAPRRWLAMASPLYLIAVIQFTNLQADMLMLGMLSGAEDVGLFAIAKSLAGFVIFVLVTIELVVAPNIARLYAGREYGELQSLVSGATRLSVAAAAPLVLLLILVGDRILALYGPAFVAAVPALAILCVGQLVNAACGPIGQLAIHTGHDRATVYFVVLAAVVNISLNAALIPEFGTTGAAFATAASMVVWNVGLTVFIFMRTGLLSFVVGSGRYANPAVAESGTS